MSEAHPDSFHKLLANTYAVTLTPPGSLMLTIGNTGRYNAHTKRVILSNLLYRQYAQFDVRIPPAAFRQRWKLKPHILVHDGKDRESISPLP